jgi:hypothetical protein
MNYRKGNLEDCKAIHSFICDMENRELPYDNIIDWSVNRTAQ